MKRRALSGAIALVAAVSVALPASAGAHIGLSHFAFAPECAAPGSPVVYDVGIRQSHWYHIHTLWARITVSHTLTGLVLFQQDEGPQYVPVGSYGSSGSTTVPAEAPPGDYNVNLALGSDRGASNWASATRTLRVRPLGICIV